MPMTCLKCNKNNQCMSCIRTDLTWEICKSPENFIDNMVTVLSNAESRSTRQSKEIESLKTQNVDLIAQSLQLQGQVKELQAQIKQLQEKETKHERELRNLERENGHLESHLESFE